MAALSKWNSKQKALKLASPDLTTKLYCLSVLLLKTKVISHIDELYKKIDFFGDMGSAKEAAPNT